VLASTVTPLSALVIAVEIKLGLYTYSPPSRGFVLFSLPYQDLLEGVFFAGIFAFLLSFFSLVHDNRTRSRISWLNR
jgi:hypothetical protein